MSALYLDFLSDSFSVCNLRFLENNVRAEFGFQLSRRNVEVLFAQTAQYLLFGKFVQIVGKGLILLCKALYSRAYLAFGTLRFGIYCHSVAWLGEFYSRQGNLS